MKEKKQEQEKKGLEYIEQVRSGRTKSIVKPDY